MAPKDHPAPGSAYTANGFAYRLDDAGRIVLAEGELHLTGSEGARGPAAPHASSHVDGLPGDGGGYLIGPRFGGSPGPENLIAQNRVCHRADYKIMENGWAHQLELGNRVTVRVEPVYPDTGERPLYLTGQYTILRPDGTVFTEVFSFSNLDIHALEQQADLLLGDDLSDLPGDPGLTPEQQLLADEVREDLDALKPPERYERFGNAEFVEYLHKRRGRRSL